MNVVVAHDAAAVPGALLVDRYFVETVLGTGSYGRVLRALDTATGTTVALKEFERDKGQSGRFLQELGVLFDLQHPNILAAESLVMAGRHRYLVCEYMEGGTLRDAILDHSLPASVLAGIVADVAKGIGYAHGRGIIHRDLKPENVLLSRREGQVCAKVADFGIAALVGSADARAAIGSPAYMAPEQFSGTYDERIDQYALGVMLFEVVCGTRPFHGSPTELLALHLRREAEVFAWVPRMLARVIRRALAKKPERRFASADHFADALRLALLHEGEAIDRDGTTVVVGATKVVSLVGRSLVASAEGIVVIDERMRTIDRLEPADEVVGSEDFWCLRRGDRAALCGGRSSRALDRIPAGARIAVSAEGAVAFEHDGAIVSVDLQGRYETVAARNASCPCFVGPDQVLTWFESRSGRSYLRLGDAELSIHGVPRDVCASPTKVELAYRDATVAGRIVLVRLGAVLDAELECGELSTDGHTFYATTPEGELASINATSSRVARTRLSERVALVGAGPSAIVCVADSGRVFRFS